MKRILMLSWILLRLYSLTLGQIQVCYNSEIRDVSPNFIGLNGRSTEGPSWTDEQFLNLVKEFNPGMVRYPAGTQANYWNWRTGTFIEGTKTAKYIVSMSDVVNGLPDETELIYVVNMARPTPETGVSVWSGDEVLRNETTLQLKIDDMLAALAEFNRLGHLPEVVELGNEFYFTNEHAAIYAGNPELYLAHSKIICQQIKAQYPLIKLLLITTKGGTSGRDYWNNTIFEKLDQDAEFKDMIHGVVQHHYINSSYGNQSLVLDEPTAIAALSEGVLYPREHQSDYNMVPEGLELWFTEFGVTKENAVDTWTSGLRSVVMTLGFVNQGDKVGRMIYHHITDDPEIIHKDVMKLGAVGVAMGLLSNAVKGNVQLQKLDFLINPQISEGIESLHGYRFIEDNSTTTLFIVNLGHQEQVLDLGVLVNDAESINQMQYWSEKPYQTNVYKGFNLNEESILVNKECIVRPYSISSIEVKGYNTAIKFKQESVFEVYPTKFRDGFTISLKYDAGMGKLNLYNLAGQLKYSAELNDKDTYHSPDLKGGLYLLQIEQKDMVACEKIVKY